MRILGRDLVHAFMRQHPDSQSSLRTWLQVFEINDFKHFNQLRQTFGSADYVRPYTVFNISGNRFRLIALIHYPVATVMIKYIFTHAQYDRIKWR
ncbi:MAG: type II toxin-antitoxin system HigB family toxin [Candidatus Omnitrophica bacterium]|nr:type II toxin-antitoxin system HigB family toxin [Candidatus Omnitrophota bacterium]